MHDRLRVQPHIVERVLAHIGHQSGIAGTYNKAEYIDEKRRALGSYAEWIDGVISGVPSNAKVINLRKRA
jgi:hypothetical protein